MRCLAVDVGNTSTALGVVLPGGVRYVEHVRGGISDREGVERALARILKRGAVKGVVLGSVVPGDNRRWIKMLRKHVGQDPMLVTHASKLSVTIDYPKPATIGADRLANACGAVAKHGAPVIVADFGTALTFDVIASGGVYVGGVIAPGLPLMTDYLADRTALLPLIRLRGRCSWVGRSTEGAMRIGAHIGYRGMVREIVEHLKVGLGSTPVTLCATGGFAEWVLSGADMPFSVAPNLTLQGLGCIFELNDNS
ncbi:MAG: type III pantothenate kinase [Verrucomicrobia bacterium]|jgi:type III pantothenate kinase|nr:type III pantothenate kinase [Verrucomicrobiota bacterium]